MSRYHIVSMMTEERSRELAGGCWADDRVSDCIMDPELAFVVAETILDAYAAGERGVAAKQGLD